MPPPGPFDVVVLGTGAAGLTAALAAHTAPSGGFLAGRHAAARGAGPEVESG